MPTGNEQQNKVIAYAYEISRDKEFLCTLLGENFELTVDRKHNYEHSLCWDWDSWSKGRAPYQITAQPHCKAGDDGWFWRTHTDYGFGISDGWHREVVQDERFSDYKWQLEQAYRLWSGGTKFYGQSNCWYTKDFISYK